MFQVMSKINELVQEVNALEAKYESHTHGMYIDELGSADTETYAPRDNREPADTPTPPEHKQSGKEDER